MGRVLSFRQTRSPPCPAQQSFPLTAPCKRVLRYKQAKPSYGVDKANFPEIANVAIIAMAFHQRGINRPPNRCTFTTKRICV
jgi:hypothetical protein